MDHTSAAPNHDFGKDASEVDQYQYDIEHEPFFTIENKQGFKFYTVEIQHTDIERLKTIIQGCEEVEQECWQAQESFYDYFAERDMVTYIVKDHKIVGFQLVSHWVIDRYVVFGLDETMVLSECRGNRLGISLCTISARLIITIFKKIKGGKYVFLSVTPNPRVINGFYKYRAMFKMVKNTFSPSEDLKMIHDKLLFRKKATLVNPDYPFFFKNMFPGSLGAFEMEALPPTVQKMIPPEIDFFERGDAFIFMAIFSKLTCWLPLSIMMMIRFGRKSFFTKHLGFWRKNTKFKFITE